MKLRDMFFNNFDKLRRKHLRRIDGGDGHFRKVYRIQTSAFGSENQGRVVKVAKRQKAVRANSAEFQTWMSVSGTPLEKFFCPIRNRSENFEFIIMDYASPKNLDFDEIDEFSKELLGKVSGVDVPLAAQGRLDIKSRNIGLHKEKGIVMIDYPWGADWKHQF